MTIRRKQAITVLRNARQIHQDFAVYFKNHPKSKKAVSLGDRSWHIYWTGVYTATLRELGAE